ncbi:ComEA family DNA-binding protein [Streptomyces sp. NPDC048277]|uniref:ComEA family DNA-binding protein n=1 Tax=Streptomyces sp. NPDC048277 TaxID=3155027 RepID=UPI0033F01DB9
MALRSRSHTTHATSGPGRGPTSDGRTRHRRSPVRVRTRHRPAPADELRRRAELLFGERGVTRPEPGQGPPHAGTVTGTGSATGLTAATATAGMRAAASGVRTAAAALSTAAAVMSSARALAGETTPRRRPALPTVRARLGIAVRERMPVWLQTRCGLERRGAVALGAVLVVAAALAVQHFWTGRTESVSAPEVVRAEAPYEKSAEAPYEKSAEKAPTGGARPATTPGGSGGEIVVDVTGKVREPGVHSLPAGSRVTDALRAAGGVRPGTDTGGLNRARFLVDGEQIVVGGPAPPAAPGQVAGAAAGAGPAAPLSLNTATVEQLDALPGVGPVLAQHIVDYRTQHVGFRSVDELRQVKGIGDRRFSDLRDLVRP